MKRDLIRTIRLDSANLDHISKTGKINGTLLIEIERVMSEYANAQRRALLLDFLNTYEEYGYAEFRGCGDFEITVDAYLSEKNERKIKE